MSVSTGKVNESSSAIDWHWYRMFSRNMGSWTRSNAIPDCSSSSRSVAASSAIAPWPAANWIPRQTIRCTPARCAARRYMPPISTRRSIGGTISMVSVPDRAWASDVGSAGSQSRSWTLMSLTARPAIRASGMARRSVSCGASAASRRKV
ncbi:hypothetical protein [Kitasatospora sp. NPDC088346]|uniref:hypothetical protein n=1 Tax=Kitasatospora sp. NPDC088346 TaxID=3364073 RepID=UPI00380E2172